MIGEGGGYGGGGGGFRWEEERERGEERVVREERGERLEESCGGVVVVEREPKRERGLGNSVEVEPALGDERDREGRTWRKFLEDFLEKLVAEELVHQLQDFSLFLSLSLCILCISLKNYLFFFFLLFMCSVSASFWFLCVICFTYHKGKCFLV